MKTNARLRSYHTGVGLHDSSRPHRAVWAESESFASGGIDPAELVDPATMLDTAKPADTTWLVSTEKPLDLAKPVDAMMSTDPPRPIEQQRLPSWPASIDALRRPYHAGGSLP